MTQAELYQALLATGYPVAYSHFVATEETPIPDPPFITYLFSSSDDLMADNSNYVEISNFQVELYVGTKNLTAEQVVQSKLKELKLPYLKTETWIESEKLFQVLYEVPVIGE